MGRFLETEPRVEAVTDRARRGVVGHVRAVPSWSRTTMRLAVAVMVFADIASAIAEQWPSGPVCNWGCPPGFGFEGGHDPTMSPLSKRRKDEVFPANAGSLFFTNRKALDTYVLNQTRTEGCFRLEQGRKLRALQDIPDKTGVAFDQELGEGFVILQDDSTF